MAFEVAEASSVEDGLLRLRDERFHAVLLDLSLEEGQGLAALIATHNPDLARRMDRVVTLRDGKIVSG